MSQQSYRVGKECVRRLIERADDKYCKPANDNVLNWTTDDLSDYVGGCIESAIEAFARLNPECLGAGGVVGQPPRKLYNRDH